MATARVVERDAHGRIQSLEMETPHTEALMRLAIAVEDLVVRQENAREAEERARALTRETEERARARNAEDVIIRKDIVRDAEGRISGVIERHEIAPDAARALWRELRREVGTAEAAVFTVDPKLVPLGVDPRVFLESVGRCAAADSSLRGKSIKLTVGPPPPADAREIVRDIELPLPAGRATIMRPGMPLPLIRARIAAALIEACAAADAARREAEFAPAQRLWSEALRQRVWRLTLHTDQHVVVALDRDLIPGGMDATRWLTLVGRAAREDANFWRAADRPRTLRFTLAPPPDYRPVGGRSPLAGGRSGGRYYS